MNISSLYKRSVTRRLIILAGLLTVHSAHADYLTMSGQELYSRFCSSCHGPSGRGDGPVSKSFRHEVPDLTLIARRQGGKFPTEKIEKVVDGRYTLLAHGTRTMPVWGQEFARTEIGSPDAERATDLLISRLVEYLRSIQKPSTER